MPKSKVKMFEEIYSSYIFYPKINGLGILKYTIFCLLTLQMVHTKFGKYLSGSTWKEDVNARQTTHNSRRTTDDHEREQTAINHLSDSADLINSIAY